MAVRREQMGRLRCHLARDALAAEHVAGHAGLLLLLRLLTALLLLLLQLRRHVGRRHGAQHARAGRCDGAARVELHRRVLRLVRARAVRVLARAHVAAAAAQETAVLLGNPVARVLRACMCTSSYWPSCATTTASSSRLCMHGVISGGKCHLLVTTCRAAQHST